MSMINLIAELWPENSKYAVQPFTTVLILGKPGESWKYLDPNVSDEDNAAACIIIENEMLLHGWVIRRHIGDKHFKYILETNSGALQLTGFSRESRTEALLNVAADVLDIEAKKRRGRQ